MSHLNLTGHASSTITSYVSGINYFQRTLGYKDLLSNQLVQKTLLGIRKTSPKNPPRRPVNIETLRKLLNAATMFLNNLRDIALFKAIICIQFFGLFRISELLGDKNIDIPSLSLEDINMNNNIISVNLKRYKHSSGKGIVVNLCSQASKDLCPFEQLNKYLSFRGSKPGPLFVSSSGRQVTKQLFATHLRRCCKAAGFQPNEYSSHSLRIGAATLAAQMGKTATEIMALGRWSSSAYMHYIRSVEPLTAPDSLSLRSSRVGVTPPAQRASGRSSKAQRSAPTRRGRWAEDSPPRVGGCHQATSPARWRHLATWGKPLTNQDLIRKIPTSDNIDY